LYAEPAATTRRRKAHLSRISGQTFPPAAASVTARHGCCPKIIRGQVRASPYAALVAMVPMTFRARNRERAHSRRGLCGADHSPRRRVAVGVSPEFTGVYTRDGRGRSRVWGSTSRSRVGGISALRVRQSRFVLASSSAAGDSSSSCIGVGVHIPVDLRVPHVRKNNRCTCIGSLNSSPRRRGITHGGPHADSFESDRSRGVRGGRHRARRHAPRPRAGYVGRWNGSSATTT